MSIQDQERAFHLWAASSGAINHREALGGLYWAQAAWKHQQSRIDQLEKELAVVRKDAERWRWGNANAGWHLGETYAHIAIPVAKDADLSCKATREDAIDAAMEAK